MMEAGKIETDKEFDQSSTSESGKVKRFLSELKIFKDAQKPYLDLTDKIKQRYALEKDGKKGRLNVFWANIENQKPSVFFKAPKVEVSRRNRDKNPVPRLAAEILERCTQYAIDSYDFKGIAEKPRDEYLMYGRGVARVRYVAETSTEEVPVMNPYTGEPLIDEDGQVFTMPEEKITSQSVECEFIHRRDYFHTPGARTWEEVYRVAYRSYLTRDELKTKFGEKGALVPLDYCPESVEEKSALEQDLYKKARVWEVWDRLEKKVYWVAEGYKDSILDEVADPLKLKRFFSSPKPVFGSLTTDSLIPSPDFKQYEKLSDELDSVTTRISNLTKAIKAAGVYDQVCEEIASLATAGSELKLIPVENWDTFGELKDKVQFLPIIEMANVLKALLEMKGQLMQELYEISGQSDIIRGATDPRETATAQGIKSQYANLRSSEKQDKFSRFIRDIVEIKAEIIAEMFEPEIIFEIADVRGMGQDAVENFEQAIQLLRDEDIRCYRIDIETDSTLAGDGQQEKESAVEFMNVLTQGLNDALPIIQARPETGKLLAETFAMVARKFKVGRAFESALDEFTDGIIQPQMPTQPQEGEQQNAQAQQGQIDASIVASQNEANAKMAQLQQEGEIKQQQMQLDYTKHQDKMDIERSNLALKAEELDDKRARDLIQQGGFPL